MVDREAGTGEAVSPGLPIETVGRVLCRKEKWQRSPLTNEYDGEIIRRTFFGLFFSAQADLQRVSTVW